jgi:hypothetical protein
MEFSANKKQIYYISFEVARFHILFTLDEIEKWVSDGKNIKDYIKVKRGLFLPKQN